MKDIIITQDLAEIERIGRELYQVNSHVYNEKMIRMVRKTVDSYMEGATETAKEQVFFRSIYSYWVYGANTAEHFFYSFDQLSHEEKSKYITMRWKMNYLEYLSDKADAHMIANKFEAYTKFRPYYKREMVLIRDRNDFDVFYDFARRHKSFVVKPAAMYEGRGVYRLDIDEEADYEKAFMDLISDCEILRDEYKGLVETSSVILEELIKEVEEMSCFHPESVNGLRICTVRVNDEIHTYGSWFRVGNGGHFVSNGAANGLLSAVNVKTGIVETNGVTERFEEFECHPVTGKRFKGFQIPKWNELIEMVTELARQLPTIGYVGWDVALTEKGWCVIEGNYYADFIGPQLTRKRGLRDEFESLIGWKPEKKFWWQ